MTHDSGSVQRLNILHFVIGEQIFINLRKESKEIYVESFCSKLFFLHLSSQVLY